MPLNQNDKKMEKMNSCSFKNLICKIFLEIISLIYMYKKDLALNALQWLKCYKIKSNQTKKKKI